MPRWGWDNAKSGSHGLRSGAIQIEARIIPFAGIVAHLETQTTKVQIRMNSTNTLTPLVAPPTKSLARGIFIANESLLPNYDEAMRTFERQRKEAAEKARIEAEARARAESEAQDPSQSRERARYTGD